MPGVVGHGDQIGAPGREHHEHQAVTLDEHGAQQVADDRHGGEPRDRAAEDGDAP
jgi:hypothetical protein